MAFKIKRTAQTTALLLLAAALCGCGLSKRVTRAFGSDLEIEVYVDQDLNQDSALAVDLVVLYDKKLADEVMEKTARDWFAGREQFVRDHPKGNGIWSWEWVPGQDVPTLEVPIGRGAHTAVLFANYLAPGPHRKQVDPREHIVIRLKRRTFKVEAQAG